MTPEQQQHTFFFEGNPVGYFVADALPSAPGHYQYMPYRGPGHLSLMTALKSAGPQRCHYVADRRKVQFTVLALISCGLLDLSDFELQKP